MKSNSLLSTTLVIAIVSALANSASAWPISGLEPALETVVLNGQRYRVPAPWAGNRIHLSRQPNWRQLTPLPTYMTENQSKIFVTEATKSALIQLFAQAKQDQVALQIDSGFRSVQYQTKILERYMDRNMDYLGLLQVVAPPGYSQHMLGTSVDFVPSKEAFAESEAYAWLKTNAGRFGFEETYFEGNETGVQWEPWHWQYTR